MGGGRSKAFSVSMWLVDTQWTVQDSLSIGSMSRCQEQTAAPCYEFTSRTRQFINAISHISPLWLSLADDDSGRWTGCCCPLRGAIGRLAVCTSGLPASGLGTKELAGPTTSGVCTCIGTPDFEGGG